MKVIAILIIISLELFSAPIKIMPFGDSITYDDSYADIHTPRPTGFRSGYRNYLWYELSDNGYIVDFVGTQVAGESIEPYFDPDNEGYPGWTSYDLAERTAEWLAIDDPDVILLHAGSNDWDKSPSGIESILNEVDRYEERSGHQVTVILALIINRNPNEKWVTIFNRNVKSMADKRISKGDNIVIVDMENGASMDYRKDMRDRTHPNDSGYQKMANVWYQAIINIPQLNKDVDEFVKRTYRYILGREADDGGLNYWRHTLQSTTAATITIEFLESEEYRSRELDNASYLTLLYHTLFDREPDDEGYSYWLDTLDSEDLSRGDILISFFDSNEFVELAKRFGIESISESDRNHIISTDTI